MSVIIDLVADLKPEQLKSGELICPIFSKVEPAIEGGFPDNKELTVKSVMVLCFKNRCGMWFHCSNQPGLPGAPRG